MCPATTTRARRLSAAPPSASAPPRRPRPGPPLALALLLAAIALALQAPPADALRVDRCWIPDVGGVVEFPPRCVDGFQSRVGVLAIENGLPPGSPMLMRFELKNIAVVTRTPGGPLGGETQDWNADLYLHLTGTGVYAGYTRTIGIGAVGATASGPQVPGAVVQAFDTDLFECFGQIMNDPEFALLRVTAGTNFGMPSPGRGSFALTGSGDRAVDSFFDITYRVDFVGDPFGPFSGLSGSTTSQMRVRAGMPQPVACSVPDNGNGTTDMTPPCPTGWTSEPQATVSLNGLPPGIPMEGSLRLVPTSPLTPIAAGTLGGDVWSGTGTAEVEIVPLNLMSLAPYTVTLPVLLELDLGPQLPGNPRQGTPARLKRLFGEILGDPVFDLLRFWGGYDMGLGGGEGHVTLVHGPGGTWMVDSFFDITYRMDMVGAFGGPLAGYASSDVETARFAMGEPEVPECTMPDNGAGTADFPPACPPGYEGLIHRPAIEQGMTPNDPLLGTLHLGVPLPPAVIPGGSLGGEIAQCTGTLQIDLESFVNGYSRKLVIPASWEIHSAPRAAGVTPQRFETDMYQLFGQIFGDPDFDLLRITGGTNFGYPSPGHTTFTQNAALDWVVDSFFDITYRVDFIGAPGGTFAGMSGSTTVVDRIVAGRGSVLDSPAPVVPRVLALSAPAPNPARDGTRVWLDLPRAGHVRATVFDVAGRAVATLADRAFEAGRHEIAWDGRESGGASARAGMYFVRVRTHEGGADRAVVLLR